jgi:hypothetical protein
MAFKLKDLMVDLLPGAGAAGQSPPTHCPLPSLFTCATLSAPTHCVTPSVQCPPPTVFHVCASPSVVQPLCPFPSVGTQCNLPSMNAPVALAAAACVSPSVNPCNLPSMNAPVALAAACTFPSVTNPPGTVDAAQLNNLATLKEQLRAQLAQVEAHEQVVHAAAKPQTVDEAQSLLQKLEEAMAELKAHIDELKKQS